MRGQKIAFSAFYTGGVALSGTNTPKAPWRFPGLRAIFHTLAVAREAPRALSVAPCQAFKGARWGC